MFSDLLKNAIRDVSGQCAGDLEVEVGENFEEILAEVTLDAGRLGMFGHAEAQQELNAVLRDHDWSEVLEAAKPLVCY